MDKNNQVENIYEKLLHKRGYLSNENIFILKNILSYWFLFLNNFLEEEGKENLTNLSKIIEKTPDHSLPYSVNTYFSGTKKSALRSTNKKKQFRIPFIILEIILFIRDYVLILDRTSSQKGWKLSSYFLAILNRSLVLSIDKSIKNEFLHILDIQNIYDADVYKFIKDNLPDYFFIKPLKEKKINFIEVHASADIFLNARSPIKLLFIAKIVKLIAYQHGVNYGQWKTNVYEDSECKISEEFHLWFPYKKNFIGRFDLYPKKRKGKETRIFWVGRINLHPFYKRMLPYVYEHKMQKNHLNIIDESFSDLNNFLFYKPEREESAWLPAKSTIVRYGPIESYIDVDKDILLFDNISETTIFFALKYRVPFLIILQNKSIKGLTKKYEDFLQILNTNEFLYNANELSKAKKYALDISNSRDLYKEKKLLIDSLLTK